MKRIGKVGIIRRKSIVTEEINLQEVTDELFEDIMTAAYDDINLMFYKGTISYYGEFDNKSDRSTDIIKLAEQNIEDDVDNIKTTISALRKAADILDGKIRRINNVQ